MIEIEWLKSDDLSKMLKEVRRRRTEFSKRKSRLFICGCCRNIWPIVPETSRLGIETAERYADALDARYSMSREEIQEVIRAARTASPYTPNSSENGTNAFISEAVVGSLSTNHELSPLESSRAAAYALEQAKGGRGSSEANRAWRAELRAQLDILRDIFGNPFRSVALNPEWRTDTVLSLSKQMYESRDFSAMPILGDALQDADCNCDDILNHCRGGGPHVRGCWVVDLVLGKE